MKKYKIGEFADAMNVTQDFIRFYERNGLIESTVDKSNGYHYYDLSQSEIIFRIQQCRAFGFSVKETAECLKTADLLNIRKLAEAKKLYHKENIFRSTYAIEQLDFICDALSNDNGTWFVIKTPSMYFLPHTVGENYIQDEKHKELYRAWAEFTPYIFSVDKLQLTNNGGIKSVYHGRAIEESVASKLNIPVDSPVEHYKARRCVEYYFESDHIKHSNPLSNDGIGSALQLIEEKDLTLNGDIFMRMFSISVENEISHLRGIIYLPVD